MLADSEILYLPKVSLETKELLPEYSGIYYVVDENKIVWYVGKATNIRKRWQGKSHHRIYQLKQLKHKYFDIHYENIDLFQLDQREKQQIEKYTPHLNNSPVKTKKVRPTETLLRETIVKISDFAFILGIEPPRREIKDKINREWFLQEKTLDTPVIILCLDWVIFEAVFNPQLQGEHKAIITRAFGTRKAYASKWEALPKKHPHMYRLSVNNYIIEISYLNFWISNQEKISRIYNQTRIAQEPIKALTPELLIQIQHDNLEQQVNKIQLQRLKPYTSDLIPLFFNESINHKSAKNELIKVSQDYKLGKRGIGSRSHSIQSKPINSIFTTIEELLISRGVNISKYNKKNIILKKRNRQELIGLYLHNFNINTKIVYSFQQTEAVNNSTFLSQKFIYGMLDKKIIFAPFDRFNIIYLLTMVDRISWLLLEEYLKDFAKAATRLNNGEAYVEKFYISPRKYIVPAKVNIKLESINYSAWIPFGMNEQYPTFETAKQEIKTRLYGADLPEFKLTFKKESIAK